MNAKSRIIAVALASAVVLGAASVANATALIQGVVFFGASTPTTDFSAPNSQVSFSFEVPDPLDANPTTDITDFSYDLNGVAVTDPVEGVEFYPSSEQGMFDIFFAGDTVSIYGADIGSSGVIGPAGFYDVTAAMNEGTATGLGGVTVGAVPEPATWAVMLLGFGGLGCTMRANRRKQLASA